jgi:hypothetical protein
MSNCEQRKMSESYRAIEVRKPGEFAEVRRPLQDPSLDQVRIRVEACSVCHSDTATVEGGFPGITYPRVPGHEVVGRIDAVGSDVRPEGRRRLSRWLLRLLRILPWGDILPGVWRLMDPKTLPTCPICGEDTTTLGRILACEPCDRIVGVFR